MEMHNDNIVRSKLSKSSVELDIDLEWDAIETKLDQKDKKKNRAWFWWFLGSTSVVLIPVLFFVWQGGTSPSQSTDRIAGPSYVQVNKEIAPEIESKSIQKQKSETNEVTYSKSKFAQINNKNTSPKISDQTSIDGATQSPPTPIAKFDSEASSSTSTEIQKRGFSPSTQLNVDQTDNTDASQGATAITKNKLPSTSLALPSDMISQPSHSNSLSNTTTLRPAVTIPHLNLNTSTVAYDNGEDLDPQIIPSSIITNSVMSRWEVYNNIQAYQPSLMFINEASSEPRAISTEFKSSFATSTGFGIAYTPTQNISIYSSLDWDRVTFVQKGERITSELSVTTQDSASVYTNSIGGDLYLPGEVTTSTTTTLRFQQHSTANTLNVTFGAQYRLPFSLYLRGEVSLNLYSSTSGNIVNESGILQSAESAFLISKQPRFATEIGYLGVVSNRVELGIGASYRTQSNYLSINNLQVARRDLGVRIRINYKLK